MATFLLTWNPKNWYWENLEEESKDVKNGLIVRSTWSCGVTKKKIKIGDRFFLAKLGDNTRGIIGSGVIESEPFYGEHWDEEKWAEGKQGLYVDIRFDTLLNPEKDNYLLISELDYYPLSNYGWTPQSSGKEIPQDISEELERFWAEFSTSRIPLAEEIDEIEADTFFEGAKRQIQVNAYERNSEARRICIKHYGTACFICSFDFEKFYGEVGRGFIHVHHLKQLSEISEEYEVDPIKDLRPICPNCHAIIHRNKKAFTIEEVQNFVELAK